MINKLCKLFRQYLFKRTANLVKETKPIQYIHSDEIVIVSQVYHNALDMSIAALKSFMQQLRKGRIEIIDDGSLTEADHAILFQHFPNLVIKHIKDITLNGCPEGGTWERLVHIINLSQEAYVIQVDTDTFTLSAIPEVWQCIENNQAFTIGNPMWPNPVSIEYISNLTKSWDNSHIQTRSERCLDSVTSITLNNYCRGCSAFTGFPKGQLSLNDLIHFSNEMENKLGSQSWREWGTEQFSSNVMISLCENKTILPWPKYQNYKQPFYSNQLKDYPGKVSVVHFIGTNRYDNGIYTKLIKKLIAQLT